MSTVYDHPIASEEVEVVVRQTIELPSLDAYDDAPPYGDNYQEGATTSSGYIHLMHQNPKKTLIGTVAVAIFGAAITYAASEAMQSQVAARASTQDYLCNITNFTSNFTNFTNFTNITYSKAGKGGRNSTYANSTRWMKRMEKMERRKAKSCKQGKAKAAKLANVTATNSTKAAKSVNRMLRIEEDDDLLDDDYYFGQEEAWLELVQEFELSMLSKSFSHTNEVCDVPNTVTWKYYDSLIEKNRNTAALARNIEDYAPKRGFKEAEFAEGGKEDEHATSKEESSIPRRLIFTHKHDLLDCGVSSSIDSDPSLHALAHNVLDTIDAYKKEWADDDVEVTFMTDEDCRIALYEVEPEFLEYYDGLAGMFKGDLCRSASLYLDGGYYFDVDIAVVHPFVANPSNEFVSVKAYNYDQDPQFFQAFIAAAPKNKIVKKSLDIMLGMLKGTHAARGLSLLGTQSMQDAWAEVAEEDSAYASHGRNNKVYLLSEENLHDDGNGFDKLPVQENDGMPLFSEGTCDFFVSDQEEESVYFYSRIVGTTFCGKLLLPEVERVIA